MAQDIQVKKEIDVEADAETSKKMSKVGHAYGFRFTAMKRST